MTSPRPGDRNVWNPAVTKTEVLYVAVGVIAIAFLLRFAYIPADPQSALDRAAESWGLAVEDAGDWFSAWSLGDGQAYAVIASDPLGLDEGWGIGQPAYRYSRVGFGWAAWMVSLGQERFIPVAMAVVGLAALIGNFLLARRLRPELGVRAWLLVLNPAIFIGFAGDTAEGLGLLLLAWSVASGAAWSAIVLGVTRPTYLIALVGRWRLLSWGVGSAATLTLLWIARFGFDPSQYGGRVGVPLVGYLETPSFQSMGLALVALVTVIVGIRARDWAWIATGLFVVCFTAEVVEFGVNAWRAGGMLFVLWAFGPGYVSARKLSTRAPSMETAV